MDAAVQVRQANLSICFAVSGDHCYGVRLPCNTERASSLYLCASSMSNMLPEISFSASGLRSLKQGLSGEIVDLRPASLSHAVNTLQHKRRRTEQSL